jgi:hypothetical protein
VLVLVTDQTKRYSVQVGHVGYTDRNRRSCGRCLLMIEIRVCTAVVGMYEVRWFLLVYGWDSKEL